MGARFLDDAARVAFQGAVEAIEGAAAVEVVIAVRRRSAGYLHANLIVGAVVAFASLAAMLFSAYPFGLTSILVDPFVVGALVGWLVELVPAAKRLLTPAGVRRRVVHHAAHAAFVERGVHTTTDRSGVLVYIAWLEGEVALVADVGVEGTVPEGALAEAEAALTRAMPRGGAAVAAALAALAPTFAEAMPRRAGDVNELSDAIDSDLARPRPLRSRPPRRTI